MNKGTSVSPPMLFSTYVNTGLPPLPEEMTLSSFLTPSLLRVSHTCLGLALASIELAVNVQPSPTSQVSPTVKVFFSAADVPCSVINLDSFSTLPFRATYFSACQP